MKTQLSIRIARKLRKQLARVEPGKNTHEMAKRLKLIGCVKNAHSDLSVNSACFENFGKA